MRRVNDGVFAPAAGVLWCTHDDSTILLSLRTGRYTTLEGSTVAIWQGITERRTVAWLCEALASAKDDDDPSAFVLQTLETLQQRGLIQRAGEPVPERSFVQATGWDGATVDSASGPPSIVILVVSLLTVRLLLRALGLRTVLRLLMRRFARQPRGRLRSEWLARLDRNMRLAEALSPVFTECLERSVVTWCAMRRVGAEAQLRFGVHVHPFAAHAWVEHLDEPIGDTHEDLMRYRMFPPLEPEALQ